MTQLRREITARLEQFRENTEARQSSGYEAARAIAQSNNRLGTQQRIDALMDDIVENEDSLLAARLARSAEDENRAQRSVAVSGALALLIAALGTVLLLLSLARSNKAEAQRRDTETRLGLLINAVADHAIYMLDRRPGDELERGRRAHQGLHRRGDHR